MEHHPLVLAHLIEMRWMAQRHVEDALRFFEPPLYFPAFSIFAW